MKKIIVIILISAFWLGAPGNTALAQELGKAGLGMIDNDSPASSTAELKNINLEKEGGLGEPDFDITNINNSASLFGKLIMAEFAKTSFQAKEYINVVVKNVRAESDVEIEILDDNGNKINPKKEVRFVNGEKVFTIIPDDTIKPGAYSARVIDSRTGKIVSEQDFTWGVLAINTNKSVYVPDEQAKISIAVLNEAGEMVCDAQVTLKIRDPKGKETELTVEDKTIIVNKECNYHNFTLNPDYEAYFTTKEPGRYLAELTATTTNGTYTTYDKFEVRDYVPLDVERISATRIYPPQNYPVIFNITANEDFEGKIVETVPQEFEISKIEQFEGQDLISYDKELVLPQAFTQNNAYNIPDLPLPFDDKYSVSLGFGEQIDDPEMLDRYKKYGLDGHDGIDFALPAGTPVNSVDEGVVILAEDWVYGNSVVIEHAWGRSYYGHLSFIKVEKGEKVRAGEVIGLSGSSGIDITGPHLHFGIKPGVSDNDNLFFGKIDPAPYLGIVASKSLVTENASLNSKILVWEDLVVKKGESIMLGYEYKAPNISPEFYTLGPLQFVSKNTQEEQARFDAKVRENPFVLGATTESETPEVFDADDKIIFRETRLWQIAADATESRYATSHITGSFTTPTNAVGSTTNTWAGDLNTNTSTTSRWAMDDPTPTVSGTQTVRVWARKGTNSNNPTIALNLYENGSLVGSIVGATTVTSTTGEFISGTFSAASITNMNNVEIEVVQTASGGSPSARNSAQIDYIEWVVNFTPAGFSVAGTVYLENESTAATTGNGGFCDGSTQNLSIRVNGGSATTGTCSSSAGTYSINLSSTPTAGDTITVYSTATQKANTVFVTDGANETGIDLYINTLIVRDEQDGTLSILDTLDYDNTHNTTDMLFDGVDTTTDTFTTDDGVELHVWTGDTFAPGGTITTSPSSSSSSNDGDIHVDTGLTTLSMGTNALSVGGDLTVSGAGPPILSISAGQITTFTATSTGHAINIGSNQFRNIVFNGSGGGWSLEQAQNTITEDVTMTAGTLSGTNFVTVNGGDVTGNGDINLTGGTFTVSGAGNFGGNTAWDFANLTFSGSSNTTTAAGTGSITVSGVMTISSGHTLDGGSKTWSLTGSGTPFVNSGTFTPNASKISYDNTTSASVTAATYYDLEFNPASGTPTYTLPADTAGSLNLGTAVKIDDAGDPGVMPGHRKHIVRDSNGTLFAVINDGGNIEMWRSTDNGDTWTQRATGTSVTGDSDDSPTVAVDSNDVLHVGYFSGGNAFYRTFSSDAWGSQETMITTNSANGGTIVIDSNDVPHIAIAAQTGSTDFDVLYANRTNGTSTWNTDIAYDGSLTAVPVHVDITINEDNIPEIAFGAQNNLQAVVGDQNNAQNWTLNTSVVGVSINTTAEQRGTNIAVDSSGNSWITYVNSSGNVALVEHLDSDAWSTWQTPVTNNNAGFEPQLTVIGSNVYVFYRDDNGDGRFEIVYDRYNGTWLGETEIATSATLSFQDVKVKGSFLNDNGQFNQIDFIYSDTTDIYYNKLTFTSGAGAITTNNNFVLTGSGTPTVNANTNDPTIDVNGNFTISSGTFSASNVGTFTIAGNFTNNGTFTSNGGTVTLDTTATAQLAYNGNTTFAGLEISTAGKTVEFDEAQQTIVNSTLTIQGTDCTTGRVFLKSITNGNQWDIVATGATVDIDYVDVRDGNAITTAITADNATDDNNNNTNWTINEGECTGGGPETPSLNQLMRHGGWFNSSGTKQPFTF